MRHRVIAIATALALGLVAAPLVAGAPRPGKVPPRGNITGLISSSKEL